MIDPIPLSAGRADGTYFAFKMYNSEMKVYFRSRGRNEFLIRRDHFYTFICLSSLNSIFGEKLPRNVFSRMAENKIVGIKDGKKCFLRNHFIRWYFGNLFKLAEVILWIFTFLFLNTNVIRRSTKGQTLCQFWKTFDCSIFENWISSQRVKNGYARMIRKQFNNT